MLDIFELSREKLLNKTNNRIIGINNDNNDEENENKDDKNNETVIIVCGNQNCGKTTLINRFMEKSYENSKTIGLDYNYVTRFKNNIKEICSIWEIGGGKEMTNLIKIPLNKDNIENCLILVFIDLSTSSEISEILINTIQSLEEQINGILKEINNEDHVRYDKILNKFNKIKSHKDAAVIQTLNVPIMFVLSRYDQFQNFESEKKKNIYKYIRYFAHIHYASVFTFLPNMESTITKLKNIMSSHGFHEGKVTLQNTIDVMKPLIIQAGTDSLEAIGNMSGAINPPKSYRDAFIQWKDAIEEYLPQDDKSKKKVINVTNDKQFAEYEIDVTLEQRRRELELYSHEKRNRRAIEQRNNPIS